jgi:ferredoxin-type protein NapH
MRVKDFIPMIVILILFYGIAIGLWLSTNAIFYLANFIIIGTSLGLGMGLFPVLEKKKKQYARRLSQAMVGGYMFLGLGCGLIMVLFGYIVPENMQIEGFWFLLIGGIFQGAVLHYLIAKIFGTILFNRGWCGWACWTAAVLDYLPWKKSPGRLDKKYGFIRYIHFIIVTGIVLICIFGLNITYKSLSGYAILNGAKPWPGMPASHSILAIPQLWLFIIGNLLYYIVAFGLAIALKDNRAFCKYACPIVTFMKIGACSSITRIKSDPSLCNQCGICERNCPMDISIREYILAKKRVTSSECIVCQNCVHSCPNKALSLSVGFDPGFDEKLKKRKNGNNELDL